MPTGPEGEIRLSPMTPGAGTPLAAPAWRDTASILDNLPLLHRAKETDV